MIQRTISSPRLRLRALSVRDLALFRALYGDVETMRHIGRPLAPEQIVPSLRATVAGGRNPRGPWFFTIVKKRDGRAIGLCSLRSISLRKYRAEVGLMLVRSARKYGYAAEALATLINAAFRGLPIDAVWVQYQPANVAAAHVCDRLGFARDSCGRSRGAKSDQSIRILQRPAGCAMSNQPTRGDAMSNIIGFLENAGRNAGLRYATREQLLQAMQGEQLESAYTDALLQPQRMLIDGLLGVRETMWCNNQTPGVPKKAPTKKKPVKAPPKKAPAKAPPKKAPAKKPAKKAPAKRGAR